MRAGALQNTAPSHGWDQNIKTDAILNDETTEIERDLCAFGPMEGGLAQFLSNSPW